MKPRKGLGRGCYQIIQPLAKKLAVIVALMKTKQNVESLPTKLKEICDPVWVPTNGESKVKVAWNEIQGYPIFGEVRGCFSFFPPLSHAD